MSYNPDYRPTGPNNRANEYYKKINHVRIARDMASRSEFYGSPISVAPGGVAPTPFAYTEGMRLDAHPDFAALTDTANWETGVGAQNIIQAQFLVNGSAQPDEYLVQTGERITLFVADDNAPDANTYSYTIDDSVAPFVVTQPQSVTVNEGQTVSMSTLAPTAASYAWQFSIDSGAVWHPALGSAIRSFFPLWTGTVTGADTDMWSLTLADDLMSGMLVRCSFNGGAVRTNTATMTVQAIVAPEKPGVVLTPQITGVAANGNTLTVSRNTTWNPPATSVASVWQKNGTTIPGSDTVQQWTITGAANGDAYRYREIGYNSAGQKTVNSNSLTVSAVLQPPNITVPAQSFEVGANLPHVVNLADYNIGGTIVAPVTTDYGTADDKTIIIPDAEFSGTVNWTASNAAGTDTGSFSLNVATVTVPTAVMLGVVDNPTYGDSAQDGIALGVQVNDLPNGVTYTLEWFVLPSDQVLSTDQVFTPDIISSGTDMQTLRARVIPSEGLPFLTEGYTLRFPAGRDTVLPDVFMAVGDGQVIYDMRNYTGTYSADYDAEASWLDASEDTIVVFDNAEVDDTIAFTGSNSGGTFNVTLTAEIFAVPFTLVSIDPPAGGADVPLTGGTVTWTFSHDVIPVSGQIRTWRKENGVWVDTGPNISVTTDVGTDPGEVSFVNNQMIINIDGMFLAGEERAFSVGTSSLRNQSGAYYVDGNNQDTVFFTMAGVASVLRVLTEPDYELSIEAGAAGGDIAIEVVLGNTTVFDGVVAEADFNAVAYPLISPTITGGTAVGSQLTCDPGLWLKDPDSAAEFTFGWFADGAPVGTDSTTYTTTTNDAGKTITCVTSLDSVPAVSNGIAVEEAPVAGVDLRFVGRYNYTDTTELVHPFVIPSDQVAVGDQLVLATGNKQLGTGMTVNGRPTTSLGNTNGLANARVSLYSYIIQAEDIGATADVLVSLAAATNESELFVYLAKGGARVTDTAFGYNSNGNVRNLTLDSVTDVYEIAAVYMGRPAAVDATYPIWTNIVEQEAVVEQIGGIARARFTLGGGGTLGAHSFSVEAAVTSDARYGIASFLVE